MQVSPGEALWNFMDACDNAASADDVAQAFLHQMTGLGFNYVALCSHVDPLNPPTAALAVFRYPEVWLKHFSSEGYAEFDPVFVHANRSQTPFSWGDAAFQADLNKKQKLVLAEGAEAGIVNGFTIPIRGAGALPASCSLIPDSSGVDPLSVKLAHRMAVFAHESARLRSAAPLAASIRHLTRRERECLTFVARGKSDWAISEILGLSERYVHHTIERAKQKLGVATRTQAVIRAAIAGEISLYDALD